MGPSKVRSSNAYKESVEMLLLQILSFGERPYSRLRSRRSTGFHTRALSLPVRTFFRGRPFYFCRPFTSSRKVAPEYDRAFNRPDRLSSNLSPRSKRIELTTLSKVYINKPLVVISPAEALDHG